MAIDTKAKRASTIGWGLRSLATLPPPDGDVGSADRVHVAYGYAMGGAVVVVAYVAVYEYTIPSAEHEYNVMSYNLTYDIPVIEQTYDIRRR